MLIVPVLMFGLFTIAAAYTPTPTEMAAFRLLAGMGMGVAMPNATTLLSKYAPQRRRSLLITIMFTVFNLGSAVIGFAAAYLIPPYGWRSVLLLGGAVPLALHPLLLLFLPELLGIGWDFAGILALLAAPAICAALAITSIQMWGRNGATGSSGVAVH